MVRCLETVPVLSSLEKMNLTIFLTARPFFTSKFSNILFFFITGPFQISRFCIKDAKVTYQCRFLQSEAYKKNKEANRIVLSEFGTRSAPDPCQTIFKRF